jgi:hypothetical protein
LVARQLQLPPLSVSTTALPVKSIAHDRLVRISNYGTGEPYFGRSGANRFDAPGCISGTPEFASCYFGLSLPLAIAETVLHDEEAVSGHYYLTPSDLKDRRVLKFKGSRLRCANLTGEHLKKLGGHADLAGTSDYAVTQQWSLAVFNNPGNFDGFVYMSRHLNTGMAVILFDRATPKIQLVAVSSLLGKTGFAAAARMFGIVGM